MNIDRNDARLAYSIAEFARLTSLSQATVKREIKSGRLPCLKIANGRVIIPAKDGLAWISKLKSEKSVKPTTIAMHAPSLCVEIGKADQEPPPTRVVVVEPIAVREKIAAEMLGIPVETLRAHRKKRVGAPYRKLGASVIYLVEDLKTWAESLPAPELGL